MATLKTAAVTAIDSGLVRKSEYRGNVQCIPVEISTDAADGTHSIIFSDVLPNNAELIAINLEHTAIGGTTNTLDIGYTGDADAIIDGADVSSAGVVAYPAEAGTTTAGAGGPIAVGGKKIIGELKGTMSSDTINGYILIVTDE
jgi:hypothetical protein